MAQQMIQQAQAAKLIVPAANAVKPQIDGNPL
jgi:hypothetical protein